MVTKTSVKARSRTPAGTPQGARPIGVRDSTVAPGHMAPHIAPHMAPTRLAPSRMNGRRSTRASLTRNLSRGVAGDAAAATLRDDSTGILGTVLIVLALLGAVILPAITTSTMVPILGGAAALIALVALASLVRLAVTDVRDAFRGRGRPTPEEPLGDGQPQATTRVAA